MSNELMKQAIADAKTLRQSAYDLAKEQIAENFGPKVKEMIRLKLSEMEDVPEEMQDESLQEEPAMHGDEGSGVDEATLDELLAELEDEPLAEAKEGDEEKAEDDSEKSEKSKEGEAGVKKDEKVDELGVEELKDIIADVVRDVMGGREEIEAMEPSEEMPGGESMEGGEELDLDGSEQPMDELSLDEILAYLEEEPKAEEEGIHEKKEDEDPHAMHKQLKEALSANKILRTELQEVNLLNAKLLYVNKIFKSKQLSESQKIKVLEAFDRAETVKEAKKIYHTLEDAVTSKKYRQPIRESVGFASRPLTPATRPNSKPIVQQDDIVNRWQVLAGIKKHD